MIVIPELEWHAAHACNLSCEACIHLSDFPLKGIVDIKTLESWYGSWNKRVIPKNMAILGGEPLLNKKIVDIIHMTREQWGTVEGQYYELVTNGFLLHKHPDLPKALEHTKCTLAISIHHFDSAQYNKKVSEFITLVEKWRKDYNFDVRFYKDNRDPRTPWKNPFKMINNNYEPYEDGDYVSSYENCITGQKCFQLYDGEIYKCPILAYLNMHKSNFGLSHKWDRYLKYQPLKSTCTDEEILEFFNRDAEQWCGLCPSKPLPLYEKSDPIVRKKTFKILKI